MQDNEMVVSKVVYQAAPQNASYYIETCAAYLRYACFSPASRWGTASSCTRVRLHARHRQGKSVATSDLAQIASSVPDHAARGRHRSRIKVADLHLEAFREV